MIQSKGDCIVPFKKIMIRFSLVLSITACDTPPVATSQQKTSATSPAPQSQQRSYCHETDTYGRPIAIVCPPDQTPEFIASLQRAFAARRLYSGDISGTWTPATVRSMRDFQSARAITTQSPSVAMAQELGLLPIDRP
jgi:hypothetical protein